MTPYKRREMESNKMLTEIMENLVTCGYRCYIPNGRGYGFIITPDDNVLGIQRELSGGWSFSFAYRQSREHGCGCWCLDDTVCLVDSRSVELAEQQGLAHARKIGARLYENSDKWLSGYWERDSLVEIHCGTSCA